MLLPHTHVPSYLLKTPDAVLNSKEGLRAKKEIIHVMNTTPKAKRRGTHSDEPVENNPAEDDPADERVVIDEEAAAKLVGDCKDKDAP